MPDSACTAIDSLEIAPGDARSSTQDMLQPGRSSVLQQYGPRPFALLLDQYHGLKTTKDKVAFGLPAALLGELALVSPYWGIQSFGPLHVALGYSVEQTTAAMMRVVIPFERGAGRQRHVAPGVSLHVQAPVLQKRTRENNCGPSAHQGTYIPDDAAARDCGHNFAGDVHALKDVHVDSGVVRGGRQRVLDGGIQEDDVGV